MKKTKQKNVCMKWKYENGKTTGCPTEIFGHYRPYDNLQCIMNGKIAASLALQAPRNDGKKRNFMNIDCGSSPQ